MGNMQGRIRGTREQAATDKNYYAVNLLQACSLTADS